MVLLLLVYSSSCGYLTPTFQISILAKRALILVLNFSEIWTFKRDAILGVIGISKIFMYSFFRFKLAKIYVTPGVIEFLKIANVE